MSNVTEDGADEVGIQCCSMDAEPVHIFIGQFMPHNITSCFNKMPSSRPSSNNQKKLALGVFCQFFADKVIELFEKVSINPSIGDNKRSPYGDDNALSTLTISHNFLR